MITATDMMMIMSVTTDMMMIVSVTTEVMAPERVTVRRPNLPADRADLGRSPTMPTLGRSPAAGTVGVADGRLGACSCVMRPVLLKNSPGWCANRGGLDVDGDELERGELLRPGPGRSRRLPAEGGA